MLPSPAKHITESIIPRTTQTTKIYDSENGKSKDGKQDNTYQYKEQIKNSKTEHNTKGMLGCDFVGRATALCSPPPTPPGLRVAVSLRPSTDKTFETNFLER